MKILLVSTSSGSRGGGELWLRYLGKGLRDLGHTVGLWVSSSPQMDELAREFVPIGEVLRSPYINTYQYPGRSLNTLFNFATSKSLIKVWASWNPDVLHINKQNLEDGLDILRAANHSPFPSICTVHITQSAQTLKASMATIRDVVARYALNQYHGELVTAPQTRADCLKNFIRKNRSVSVVLNGVPDVDRSKLTLYRSQKRIHLNLNEDEILFTTVGRMVAQKNPMYFLRIALEIRKILPCARFLWVGDGNLTNNWDLFIKENTMQNFVQRLPWQSEVIPWLAASDVYLHLAEFEGMPFSVLEALSVGLPCLITQNLMYEIPPFKADGILCVEDTKTWLDKIIIPEHRNELGNAARNVFKQEFCLSRMATDYLKIYQHVLQG